MYQKGVRYPAVYELYAPAYRYVESHGVESKVLRPSVRKFACLPSENQRVVHTRLPYLIIFLIVNTAPWEQGQDAERYPMQCIILVMLISSTLIVSHETLIEYFTFSPTTVLIPIASLVISIAVYIVPSKFQRSLFFSQPKHDNLPSA